MVLECSIEDCVALVSTKVASESSRKGQKDVFLRLKDSEGEVLSEIKVPWPDGEPEPCEVSYLDSEECLRLTNNATFAAVPLRISKIREVFRSRRPVALPKRFHGFSNPPVPVDDANQIMLHSALKEFVKEPLADGTWKKVVKCLSLKDVDADGVLTRDEEAVILHFLPTQSLSSKELKSICEGLRKANVFGPSSLASFYELCLNLGQTSIVRSAVESSDALSEQCIAMFLNFVAGESEDKDDHLLPSLLTRRFDPRRMANAAARRVTTQNASVLMRKCMDIYVSPKHGDIAEQEAIAFCHQALSDVKDYYKDKEWRQSLLNAPYTLLLRMEALSLMSVLTDTFGNRLVWENELHDTVKEALEFSERLSEIVSSFNQIDTLRTQVARAREEEESLSQYRVEKVSLPRRTLNW